MRFSDDLFVGYPNSVGGDDAVRQESDLAEIVIGVSPYCFLMSSRSFLVSATLDDEAAFNLSDRARIALGARSTLCTARAGANAERSADRRSTFEHIFRHKPCLGVGFIVCNGKIYDRLAKYAANAGLFALIGYRVLK